MLGSMQEQRCAGCGRITPGYDIINSGSVERGYRQLCSKCFNEEMATLDGLDEFTHVSFEPITLASCDGDSHEFHFQTRLIGDGVVMDAFELRDGYRYGYQFQVIGDPEVDLWALFGRLMEKIRRALSVKHVVSGDYGLQIADRMVRGRIEWDSECDGRVPLVIVDGRELSWDDLGRMLMTFEGWQFRLEIRDMSEEV